MTKYLRNILIALCATSALAACGDAKKELGLARSAPDEFAVVKRAPLEMPPEFSLRPPTPGAPRPQEQAMTDEAAAAVLGQDSVTNKKSAKTVAAKGEDALMEEAGIRYNPDIRQIIDAEATQTAKKDQPVVKKLLNIGKEQLPPAKVVDAPAEAARIKQNATTGQPVTTGETPAVDE